MIEFGRRATAFVIAIALLTFAPACGGGDDDDAPPEARTLTAVYAADVRLPRSAARSLRALIDAAHVDDPSFDVSADRRSLTLRVADSDAGRAFLDSLSTIGVVEFRPLLETETAGKITPVDRRRPQASVVLDGTPGIPGVGRLLLGPSALPDGAVRGAHAQDSGVVLVLTPDGTAALNAVAAAGIESHQLAIVVDGQVISAPSLEGADFGSEVQISGKFTQSEAEALAEAIGGGPVHLRRRSG